MAYYDALITQWKQLSGTTQEKLNAINAMTVPDPNWFADPANANAPQGTIPWWQANGYTSHFNLADLGAAGDLK